MAVFRDGFDELVEQIEKLLDTYTLEDILEDGGLTIAEALALLVTDGYLALPETKPVN
jgi:hypothetical protein